MAYQAPEMEGLLSERTDAQKRAAVFLKAPETILVKVLAMGMIDGVAQKARDNLKVEIKHTLEAIDRGLNPMGVRENRTDTGFCLFQKEEGVRIDSLLQTMWEGGYVLEEFFWQIQNEKMGPTHTFRFVKTPGKRPEDGVKMPPAAVHILTTMRFNHCTVWCNLRDRQDGNGQCRLDTINLAKGRQTCEPSRQLKMDGHTYRLV